MVKVSPQWLSFLLLHARPDRSSHSVAIYRLKGTSGSVINRAFTLSGKLLIGRADDCDIRIEHGSVSPRHAEVLLAQDGSVRLRDLESESGTRLNGEFVSDAILSGGDELHIGNCRLMLQAPGLRPDRVLEADKAREKKGSWPWLLALAFVAGALLAWQNGYLETIASLIRG